jgi:hypothetical protein
MGERVVKLYSRDKYLYLEGVISSVLIESVEEITRDWIDQPTQGIEITVSWRPLEE